MTFTIRQLFGMHKIQKGDSNLGVEVREYLRDLDVLISYELEYLEIDKYEHKIFAYDLENNEYEIQMDEFIQYLQNQI